MPNDSSDRTLRKHRLHRNSPDGDDSEETHKRRKQHHHHHRKHRHRSHHHRSKKDDVTKETTEVALEEKEPLKEEHNGDHSCPNDVVVAGEVGSVVNGASLGIDYDMEEGEIVEEVEGGRVGISGVNFDTSSMGGDVSHKVENSDSCLPLEDRANQKHGKSGPLVADMDNSKDRTTYERKKNKDLDRRRRSKHDSPSDEHDQRIDRDVGGDVKNLSSSLSSESGEKNHRGLPSSPSQDRHGDGFGDGFTRNLEKLPEPSRGRSRSRSVHRDVLQLDSPTELDHGYHLNSKHRIDSDDEQATDTVKKYQHRSKDHPRDKGRDQSPSYSRHMSRSDRHHSRDSRGKVREGSRDVHRDRSVDRKIAGERARERERREDRDRDRGIDRNRDGDRDIERERRLDREREDRVRRGPDNDSSRYRNQDRNRDIEVRREHNHHKYDDSDTGYVDRDNYDDSSNRRHRAPDGKERVRESYTAKTDTSRKSLKAGAKFRSDEDEEKEYQVKIELELANQEEDDIEKIKEESRRRREAILMKYSNQKFQQKPDNKVEDSEVASVKLVEQSSEIGSAANGVHESSGARLEGSDDYVAEPLFSVGKSPQPNRPAFQKPSDTVGLGAGTPKSERSDDMFCDDIFGDSPAGVRKTGKGDGLAIEKTGLHDNWDDAEGYYSYRFGEILDNRYEIIAAHGKGVFSTVIRAKDLKARPGDPEEVAIKIIRSNDTMYKAGMDEMVILKKLVGADPENKRHCVRFLSNFKYRNHLCLVFESLHMNLREVLKKFGRNIGLRLTAVRAYAKQLFIALKHLKNCGVLHCDIKPDNMLVNEPKNVLKLCDFGNAMFAGKNEITPYLVSRFYRAPEIILGLPYDHPMDIWSVGCCLFELFMGKVLFPGASNNEMLRLHMELKGPFPKKMLRKAAFTVHHFDQDLNFLATEEDPVTKKAIKRLMLNVKPKDVGNLIVSSGEDPKMLANFKDLLEKVFVLDPEKRITVSQALSHPFITGK